jgi:hypothetical protein
MAGNCGPSRSNNDCNQADLLRCYSVLLRTWARPARLSMPRGQPPGSAAAVDASQGSRYTEAIAPNLADGDALFRPRPERLVWTDHAASGRGLHGGTEGAGHLGSEAVQRGQGRIGPRGRQRDATGGAWPLTLACYKDRRHLGLRAQGHIRGGDRNGPARRAGDAVRRYARAAQAGFATLAEGKGPSPRSPTSNACRR